MNKKLIIMLLAMFVAGTTDLFSQSMNKRTEETPQSVIANVHKAAQLLKEKGSEALAVLTDPKSEFNDRDAYLFIIDVDKSLVVSNPRFPERTGGNIREHLDWSGKHYGVELCEVAMRGGGWIEFVWPKPGTEKGVRKVSYIYPIPGMRYTVCAGIYNDSMTLDELNALTGHGKKESGCHFRGDAYRRRKSGLFQDGCSLERGVAADAGLHQRGAFRQCEQRGQVSFAVVLGERRSGGRLAQSGESSSKSKGGTRQVVRQLPYFRR